MDDVVVLGASALLMTRELGMSLRPLKSSRRLLLGERPTDDATVTSPFAPKPGLIVAAAQKGGAG